MTKLLCPNCMKTVSVPDDAAGTDAPCPECGEPISVPQRYNPAVAAAPVPTLPPPAFPPSPTTAPARPEPPPMSSTPTDRPPPPPGLVPPPYPYPSPNAQLEPPLPPEPPVPPVPAGYTRSRGVAISPQVMAWVPVVCLTTILVLTFFNWIGSYVGGYPVYAQSAWGALRGKESTRNIQLEQLMKEQAPWPVTVLDKMTSDWPLMLPYLLCVILATVMAWAERLVASLTKSVFPRPLQWIPAIWPYRIPMIAGLSTIALILLLVQVMDGFGLERAMREVVSEKFAAERKAAESSPAAQAAIDFREDQELARFNLERTSWLYLAIVLHVLVVLAMAARGWLDRRGNRPPPRIVLQY